LRSVFVGDGVDLVGVGAGVVFDPDGAVDVVLPVLVPVAPVAGVELRLAVDEAGLCGAGVDLVVDGGFLAGLLLSTAVGAPGLAGGM
jgi:hypothetical protein